MKQTLGLAHRRRRTILIATAADTIGADCGWNGQTAEEQDGGAEDE